MDELTMASIHVGADPSKGLDKRRDGAVCRFERRRSDRFRQYGSHRGWRRRDLRPSRLDAVTSFFVGLLAMHEG